jgi:hypothetical protein
MWLQLMVRDDLIIDYEYHGKRAKSRDVGKLTAP